jgi:hypothetical protein
MCFEVIAIVVIAIVVIAIVVVVVVHQGQEPRSRLHCSH